MSQYKFLNNKETVLAVDINSGDTSIPVASMVTDILSGYDLFYDEIVKATFSNASGDIEIIHILKGNPTGGPITSYDILRGQEGTSALTWVTGDKLSLRITSGILENIVQNHSKINSFTKRETFSIAPPKIQNLIYTAKKNNTIRTNSTFISSNTVYIDSTGGIALIYLKEGTTASIEPSFSSGILIADGNAVVLPINIVTEGHINITGTSLGEFSNALATEAISIGTNTNTPSENGAISSGDRSVSFGGGYSIGSDSLSAFQGIAYGNKSLALGEVAYRDRAFTIQQIAAKPTTVYSYPYPSISTNLVSVVWSYPIDFSGGTTWSATASYPHGSVIKPTVANGFQYFRIDNKYTNYSKILPTTYTPGLSGGTEPTWSTTEDASDFDGDGFWLARNNTGSIITLGSKFLVKKIGIVLFDAVSVSSQPQISFGTTGNNTLFLTSTTTTNLTATNKVQMYDINSSQLVDNFTITLDTLATASKMLGQVFFEGFLIEHWL